MTTSPTIEAKIAALHHSIRLSIVALALLLIGSPIFGATLLVPGDYPTIQQAIDNAQPGDIIRVLGGTHDPVVIDKALTIVGSPLAVIDNSVAHTSTSTIDPAILLAGPGSGRVSLVNLRVDNSVTSITYAKSAPAVRGGGFTSLFISDCVLEAPNWDFPLGLVVGVPGVDVTVPEVVVSGSHLRGSASDAESPLSVGKYPPPSGAGLRARFSTVTLLDSTVVGGDGSFVGVYGPRGPCPCDDLGGEGAPGVIARRVLHANAQVSGGQGGPVYADVLNQPTFVGYQAAGNAFEADEVVALDNALTDSGSLALRAAWTLHWNTPSPMVLLLVSTDVTPPSTVPGKGLLFLDPDALTVIPVPSIGGGQLSTTVPTLLDLIGNPVGVQIYDPISGLTRPVLNVFQIP